MNKHKDKNAYFNHMNDASSNNNSCDCAHSARRYTGMFAGLVLVILGIILLLNVLGILQISIWHALATYWPIGLILIGIAIMLRLRWLTITFLILTVILCTAFLADTLHTNHIQGSGVIVSKTYNVTDFSGVELKTPVNVHLSQGDLGTKPIVTITGDDNILQVVDATVQGNTLVIRYTDGFMFWNVWNSGSLDVYITSPNIDSVRIDGAGSVTSDTKIVSDNLKIVVSGAGDVSMDVAVDNLETEISGFGDITLKGTATNYISRIDGAGNIDAYELYTDTAKIRISGSGNVYLNVAQALDVTISGAGDVKYKGNPVVTQQISGAGDISQEN